MDELTRPSCRSTDLIQLGLGRQRRCRMCGRVWIATNLPATPVQARDLQGLASGSSSSRAAAGLAGLATLRDHALAPQVREVLSRYLQVALVNYRYDEGDAWTFRAMPGTKAIRRRRRLFTVNVSNMEVLVAHYDPVTGKDTGGFLVLQSKNSPSALRGALRKRDLYPAPYATAGDAAAMAAFNDLDDLLTLLSLPIVHQSARSLNDRLRSSAKCRRYNGSGTSPNSSNGWWAQSAQASLHSLRHFGSLLLSTGCFEVGLPRLDGWA